jgi:HSP20 family protein
MKMDIEKMRKWLEITNEYKKSDFWTSVLEEKYPNQLPKKEECTPKLDIYQDENYNYLIFEIPGVNQNDISLHLISHTRLKISGKIMPIFSQEMEIRKERVDDGEFERVIELPEATFVHLMNIQIYNGLLHVSYPRKVEPISFNS